MARKKIKIKKIDSILARQVTFSKRRRGLIKKADELSILCGVDVCLVVLSSTGKLYEFSNSSIKEIIERYNNRPRSLRKPDVSSPKLQVETSKHSRLRRDVEELNFKLSQMKGEELQGLTLEELQELQKTLEFGLHRVLEKKSGKIMEGINGLEQKSLQLVDENARLLQEHVMVLSGQGEQRVVTTNTNTFHLKDGQCSEFVTILSDSGRSSEIDDILDTSLKLGLPFPNRNLKMDVEMQRQLQSVKQKHNKQ